MLRRTMVLGTAAAGLLAACGGRRPVGAGESRPGFYVITPEEEPLIPVRLLESVNSLRAAAGAAPVALDDRLAAAAATHSRDMSVQNRPWHFGSDGSSPLVRLARVGYPGGLVGEVISESYEPELVTLAAWMEDPDTRDVILNPAARSAGVGWFQEPSGKLWWTMVLGA
jgi:uncharacterized protein YkwD